MAEREFVSVIVQHNWEFATDMFQLRRSRDNLSAIRICPRFSLPGLRSRRHPTTVPASIQARPDDSVPPVGTVRAGVVFHPY